MDKDENLTAYDVTYGLTPGNPSTMTRTDMREWTVGLIKYVKDSGRWKARFRDDLRDGCDGYEEFATIDEARSYLVRRYEETVYGEGK